MAVEIKEIVVKAIVAGNQEKEEGFDKTKKFPQEEKPTQHSEISRQALIQSCVDQVLKILQKRSLR